MTPEEKRVRLFNIYESFELPMEEFNKEWWPLVSNVWTRWGSRELVNGDEWKIFACRFLKHNQSSTRKEEPSTKRRKTNPRDAGQCFAKIKITYMTAAQKVRIERHADTPDHAHTLEDSDRLKRSQTIKTLIEQEASKPYTSPAIAITVKELAKNLGISSSAKNVVTKDVANIKQKIRKPENTGLIGESDLESDIQAAEKFLMEKGYRVDRFSVSQRSSEGFGFADPWQMQKLTKHGWLTLIDSTHDTNKHGWRLFTLYIRDGCSYWNVGAHFFLSSEDSDTVAAALVTIRRFAPRWEPRYMLADQSSVEANAVKAIFPGTDTGEQICDLILCNVHVMRVWMKKIYHTATRNKMIIAMHKRTKIGCEEVIRDAITTCPVQDVARYIHRNYERSSERWALWARQHSPLLLQITSTNALESYHSELKVRTSRTYGLIGE